MVWDESSLRAEVLTELMLRALQSDDLVDAMLDRLLAAALVTTEDKLVTSASPLKLKNMFRTEAAPPRA